MKRLSFEVRAFRDKYLAAFALLLTLCFSQSAFAQFTYHIYVPQWYDKMRVDSALLVPLDTVLYSGVNSDHCRQIAKKNGILYTYNCDSSKWVPISSAATWQQVMSKGNITSTDAILDGGGSFGNLRLSSRYNGSNRLYSMTTGAGSFKPFQILSGGLMVSDRAGSAASDNGTDALQVMGSTLTNGITSNGSATFNSTVTVSSIASSLLKTDGTGRLFPAVAGADYASLDGAGKIPISQIPDALVGAVVFQGNYNASTNTPALPSATGNKGNYWVVSTAGIQFGLTLAAGDWIISNGSVYQKVDNNNAVTSVAGRVGAVVIDTGDISGFSGKVRSRMSAGPGIAYSSTNGVITNVGTLQQATDNGSATSNQIFIVTDTGSLRLQQASPNIAKNTYIRWSTYLNQRELANIGFRENITGDSSFNLYNRVGPFNFTSASASANDIKINGNTIWNSGNVGAGTGISITGTGPYTISSTYTLPSLQSVMGVSNQSNVIYNSIVPTGESFRFNNGGWGSIGSTYSAQETYVGMNAYVKGSDATNQMRYIFGTLGYSYFKLNASAGSFRVFGTTTSSTADAVISSPTELLNISPSAAIFDVSISLPTRTVTASRTLDGTDYTVRTATSGITLTLPSASGCIGRIYELVNESTGSVTVSAVLVFGTSTTTIPTNTSWRIQSDGTNWRLLSRSN